MSKKNKQFNNEVPEIYNVDDIGYMADEALYERANRLENERNRMVSSGKDAYHWEVEIAYLRREQQLRVTRSERHAEFLKKFVPESVVEESLDSAVNDIEEEPVLN